ncbi:hypothetical protein BDV95DRAFT_573646 [Massariosphaeria phaeospora]|uniref:WW domain-containing protein n=1 Tax=Massariosphaeria phaeospora TaxID=100035 RepID=A0A7C8I943_9PLEO|nr:hypothetical protein BDV95DRAFT_573646 [Massariosphaeria phaeospora]
MAKPDDSPSAAATDKNSPPPLPAEPLPRPEYAPPQDLDRRGEWLGTRNPSSGIWYYVRDMTTDCWSVDWANGGTWTHVVNYSDDPSKSPRSPSNAFNTSDAATNKATARTIEPVKPRLLHGGYNPKIHGSYNPNADYAVLARQQEEEEEEAARVARAATVTARQQVSNDGYSVTAHFNRFNGRFQGPSSGPEMHNDDNKSRRQLNAYFNVDDAANSHNGRSLKAERRNKVKSKKQVQEFKQKRKDKKEQKRREWLLN